MRNPTVGDCNADACLPLGGRWRKGAEVSAVAVAGGVVSLALQTWPEPVKTLLEGENVCSCPSVCFVLELYLQTKLSCQLHS